MKNLKKVIFGCSCVLFLIMSNSVFASTGKVTGKTVRIRESADSSSKILTNAYKNDEVNVIETNGNWYKVEYEGKTGYINKDYVEVKTEPSSNQEQPSEKGTEEKNKIIKESNLKLLPNFSSRNIGIIQKDTEIEIKQEFNNWVEIATGDKIGWILKNNITGIQENISTSVSDNESEVPETPDITVPTETENTNTESQEPENINTENEKKEGYINIDTARIRETAGGKIIGTLDLNDKVTIVAEEGEWYKITCSQYEAGYVSKSLVSNAKVASRSLSHPRSASDEEFIPERIQEENIDSESISEDTVQEIAETIVAEPVVETNKGQEIVDYAKSFLGSRYVSGGTSPSGFDCSGFTQYVYSHFGYSIARVASGQSGNGVEVARENLELGDLIIFLDYGKSSIGHVGIYIGNGNFIHAANPSRGVVIDNLTSNSYYNQRYVTARRII